MFLKSYVTLLLLLPSFVCSAWREREIEYVGWEGVVDLVECHRERKGGKKKCFYASWSSF